MTPISQGLKDASYALAESIQSEGGARLLSQLRQLLHATQDELPTAPVAVQFGPRRIGIWEPRKCGVEYRFERPAEPCEQASLWANVGSLEPKGRHKRVVLIGESVARGFFFDPHFNPAMVLQNMLRVSSGEHELDVVDLARTDLTMESLVDLAGAAIQLKPDVIIVLAGNNWQPTVGLSPSVFHNLSECLRIGDWADVKTHLEKVLRDGVHDTIRKLLRLAETHRFKLIFALPEFNLVDWNTAAINPPLLGFAATSQWHTLRKAAENALAEGDLACVERLGLRLLALDKGTTSAGFNLIAEAKLKVGATAEARKYLEAARDSAICWPNGPESPRCFTAVQDTVRDEAKKKQLLLVDLPCTFQSHLRGGLPDRRLFLDYCHFNVAGTHLAMAAIAQVVLASVYKVRRPLDDLKLIKLTVDPSVEGEAHFLAAIHNSNWGQKATLVRQHCDRALELSPKLARIFNLYLDFHVRRIPSSLCQSFDELCQSCSVSATSLLFDSVRATSDKFLNPTLIGAIAAALDARYPRTPSVRSVTNDLLCAEHGVNGRMIDLLNKAYSSESYLTPLNRDNHAFYRAGARISQFKLICKHPRTVRLDLTYRTRSSIEHHDMLVKVNTNHVRQVQVSPKWTTETFLVPGELLHSGINSIEIHWPAPGWDIATWVNQVSEGLANCRLVDVNPVYGEIHSFLAEMLVMDENSTLGSTVEMHVDNQKCQALDHQCSFASAHLPTT